MLRHTRILDENGNYPVVTGRFRVGPSSPTVAIGLAREVLGISRAAPSP